MGRFDHLHPKADEVLDLLLSHSLERIGRMDGMPSKSTILRWPGRDADWATAYADALTLAGHAAADEARHIRERLVAGELPADVARAAQQSCAWEAACRVPKVYGNKVQAEHSGGVNVQVVTGVPDPTD